MTNIDHKFLTKIAQQYYQEGKTQEKIAKKFHISRPTVSRLLSKAKEEGIVTIAIKNLAEDALVMEKDLEDRGKLREAILVSSKSDPVQNLRSVAEAAALFLDRILKDGDLVGVSWGVALREVANSLRPSRKVKIKVVPLTGGVGQTMVGIHANSIATKIAEEYGGTAYLLHAPAIVDNREIRDVIIKESRTKEILEMGKQVDVALVGIGFPNSKSTMVRTGYFSLEDIRRVKEAGGVGDICARFFDQEGGKVITALDERIIGLDLDELKSIDCVVGVMCGEDRAKAAAAAMKGGLINVLVTDTITARKILRVLKERVNASTKQ
ncbi:sugar-binding transcriptional regulator [Candidatus Hakubella thermalkaliphila]|uniref:Deoxyribonucleoside regulator n=3 Tax=Candidatus Hakubella thermalkaliphila TaxID=2754717 RepID=A0A6V8Q5J8_9ACTN|nr:sugar-binding transcriptional regulator [Candidatus Hakubella thermalkaliphila]GFP30558.1 deoxyribonucleoside regulator [Candidatus Hakubella thermalkaliphila]GFP39710.1 deoxyribonucleoside regulator [Candidatus Hakubella thermalkaliphila]